MKLKHFIGNILFWISHFLFGLYTEIFLKKKVIQLQKKIKGPVVFASNHPSTSDPFFLLGILMKPVSIVITEFVYRIKLVGLILRWANHIRTGGKYNKESYLKSVKYLKAGKSILIMPEGKVHAKSVGKLHTGAVRMALEAKVPIVPIAIALDENKIKAKPFKPQKKTIDIAKHYYIGKYVVVIGKPKRINGHVNDRNLVKRETDKLQCEMNKLIAYAKNINNYGYGRK